MPSFIGAIWGKVQRFGFLKSNIHYNKGQKSWKVPSIIGAIWGKSSSYVKSKLHYSGETLPILWKIGKIRVLSKTQSNRGQKNQKKYPLL